MRKVMITGMSGLIGGVLRNHLDSIGGYQLSALNRTPVEGVNWFQVDISDLEKIQSAFEGQDTVVHLAALPGSDDWEGNLSSNVIGTYNVYEAARRAGVKRVVFASSGATVVGYAKLEPYKALREGSYMDVPEDYIKLKEDVIRPGGIYGATKVWGEALGRSYSDAYGISIICVRIGQVWPENRPKVTADYARWLSHRDIASMMHKCIEASDEIMFDVFNCTSDNKWGYVDLGHAKEVLGWAPIDSAEAFR